LLVVNKPAGLSTHSPSRYSGEGLYEWLRNREPSWAGLAIIHRLDKETSGVMVFSKTALANRSLTQQFTERKVGKKYIFLTDRTSAENGFTVKSCLVRTGDRYVARPVHRGGQVAETRFESVQGPKESAARAPFQLWEAAPLTGKTHQIRVHAAEQGLPILGDVLYGGSSAARVFLHALQLEFEHPGSGQMVRFEAEPDFDTDPRLSVRSALIHSGETNAFRMLHGASDGWPGWYLDRLGPFLLSQSEDKTDEARSKRIGELTVQTGATGAYHKILSGQVRKSAPSEAAPRHVFGNVAPERFEIRENGLRFEMSFTEGYSTGLFLDQRDNRRRLLTGYIAPRFLVWNREEPNRSEVLNVFAYTCAFSACAAKAGARVTSLDLSKKYLEWGKRNFALNELDPGAHDFIYGDAFNWMRRLAKKKRQFQLILLDPPTFSKSKDFGTFRAEKDYGELLSCALPLLAPGGVLFCSTNAAGWKPEDFLKVVEQTIKRAGRSIVRQHYAPQPPDFPVSRNEPAYLKTVWLRVEQGSSITRRRGGSSNV
jgi:23S rRNA (cytosine1962-C5)-methyltransferase